MFFIAFIARYMFRNFISLVIQALSCNCGYHAALSLRLRPHPLVSADQCLSASLASPGIRGVCSSVNQSKLWSPVNVLIQPGLPSIHARPKGPTCEDKMQNQVC